MYGISLDDNPDRPVATPSVRRSIAIHWNWTTDATHEEMANALGVTERTIRNYINDGPTEGVRDQLESLEAEVRMIAVAELRDQLKAAGDRSKTAEKPVKVWTDPDGNLRVNDKIDPETGELTGKYPVPHGMTVAPDEQARYYARDEVRSILDQLTTLVGAGEPEQHAVEHSGGVSVTVENTIVETDDDR